MKDLVKRLPVNLLPLLMGVLAFLIVVGPRALNPQNIAWLSSGDPATHYLGWVFFRNAPWSFPVGLNPSYGLELSNAIVFSDSNPLFALLFKPFAALLPEPFQYFGLWFLMCFMLQSWFAWKLMGLASDHLMVRLLGSALFLFAPAMILRMGEHLSLAGHFLVLAALYLALRPSTRKQSFAWAALLVASALVHAYLLAMVALIWLADLLARTIKRQLTPGKAFAELAGILVLTGFCCWQAGYFSVDSAGLGLIGFGLLRANVLTFFDSAGWSYVLGDLPGVPGDIDGLAFPGLGVIFLTVCALPLLLSGRSQFLSVIRPRWVLLLALFGLMIYAFSNNVGIGPFELHYWLPEFIIAKAGVFRAAGRMIWPVMYATIFAVLFVIVRGYSSRTAVLLFATALVLQVVDTRAGWETIRSKLMASPSAQWKTPLVDPFWSIAASHYQKVRWIKPQSYSTHWIELADYAGKYHLATDAVYLGRVNYASLQSAQSAAAKVIASGRFEADSLYVLDQRSTLQAAFTIDRSTDSLIKVDGFQVLAPGWKRCSECPQFPEADLHELIPAVRLGERIQFTEGGSGSTALAKGWWDSEAWGTGSVGKEAEVILRPSADVSAVSLETNTFLTQAHPRQAMEIRINDIQVLGASLTTASNTFDITLPAEVRASIAREGFMRLKFNLPLAISPRELGMGDDERELAIGLLGLTLH